jgi:hypothetical protein
MKKIKVSSAKAKARRLQQWVAKYISEITGIKWGEDELIQSRPMGQGGIDVPLLGKAQEMFPFSSECKWQEKWDIPGWIRHAKHNKIEGTDWLLFVKKNRHEEIVIMDAKAFFDFYEQLLQEIWK